MRRILLLAVLLSAVPSCHYLRPCTTDADCHLTASVETGHDQDQEQTVADRRHL